MTTNQKILIGLVLSAMGYGLFAIGKYFLADVKFAAGQNLIRSFQATGEAQYLPAAYKDLTSAVKINPREPAILAEAAVSAAYVANAIRASDATAASQLASQSLSLSQLALSISPRHPNHYKSAARALILLSDVDQRYLALAAQVLEQATKISPTDPRLPYNLGVIYNYLAATPSAVAQFQKALQLKPDFPDPARQLQHILDK